MDVKRGDKQKQNATTEQTNDGQCWCNDNENETKKEKWKYKLVATKLQVHVTL